MIYKIYTSPIWFIMLIYALYVTYNIINFKSDADLTDIENSDALDKLISPYTIKFYEKYYIPAHIFNLMCWFTLIKNVLF